GQGEDRDAGGGGGLRPRSTVRGRWAPGAADPVDRGDADARDRRPVRDGGQPVDVVRRGPWDAREWLVRCQIVAVGTESLLGQIGDTNSAWLGEQLALAGIDCTQRQTVGDNLQRMVDAIQLAVDRSDAVIVCGGLGPTQDDITREAIAQVM